MAHRRFGGTLVLAFLATAVACGGSSSDDSARSQSGGAGGSSASATGGRSGSSGHTGGSDVGQAGGGDDLPGGTGGTSGAPAGSGGSSGAPGGTGGTGGSTAGSGGAPGGSSGAGDSGAGATLAGGGTGGECPTGYTNCEGTCVDLRSDENNCGDCGFSCRGLLCYVGSCEGTIPTGGTGGYDTGGTGGSGGSTGGSGGSGGTAGDPEANCLDAGGIVTTAVCCEAVGDYPNTCLDGACGCGLEYSHEVQVCNCPAGYCFNGSECMLESVSAYLLWMAPGGAVGTGPAMELLEDGTLRLWQSTEGMPVRNTSGWDLELTLTPQENGELVRLMLAVDDTDLPHATDWFECAPSLYFEGSDGTSMDLDYGSATALSPEFDDVYAWLQSYFADSAPDYRGPWQYCVF